MGRDVATEPSVSYGIGERFLDSLDRLTIPLDNKSLSAPLPAPQMRQKLIG